MNLRALIVDDEAPARSRMQRMLQSFSEIEVIGEASNGLEALTAIQDKNPDVVFLDIEMPELNGLGVARTLGDSAPTLIFVTAFDEFVIDAFEVSALDYLVKPVSEARLNSAIQKLVARVGTPLPDLTEKLKHIKEAPENRKFAIKTGNKYVVLDPKKVSAVLAKDHYAAVLMEGRELLTEQSLEVMLRQLDSDQFLRVHRSAIINLDYLAELEHLGDRKYVAILSSPQKTRVPISREHLNVLKDKIGLRD